MVPLMVLRALTAAVLSTLIVGCTVATATVRATATSGMPALSEPASTASVEVAPLATSEVVCDGTPTLAQTEGPYYTPGSPERSSLIESGTLGEPLILTGRVLTPECEPISGAVVDVWQADGQGEYDNVGFGLRGRVTTDGEGRYTIDTVVPGVYPGRTPHIHIKVFAPDGRELLTSQIYLPGLSDQIPDGIFSEELLATDLPPDAEGRRQIEFDIIVSV
jgi:protocatechuate 3,4-dioxygenase beta subunit